MSTSYTIGIVFEFSNTGPLDGKKLLSNFNQLWFKRRSFTSEISYFTTSSSKCKTTFSMFYNFTFLAIIDVGSSKTSQPGRALRLEKID